MHNHQTQATAIRRMLMSRLLPQAVLVFLLLIGTATGRAEDREYQLGPGDAIHIQVFQNPDLTLDTRVTELGTISYPLVGSVQLGGLTLGAAGLTIAQKLEYGGFMVHPQVTVTLVQNHANQVSVLGQVNRPGRYPLETVNTRLSEMLATAGGIQTTGADTLVLTGARDGQPIRKEIDIAEIFGNGGVGEDMLVAAGDVLYIPRAPVFYIYGEVQHAGSYRLEKNMQVRQALAQGGGLTPRGTERGLVIERHDPNGKMRKISPKLTDLVQANDVIQVQESLF